MKRSRKVVETQSIRDYLKLELHSWMVEFDACDFGASLSALFELPHSVYLSQAKDFFWKFLTHFFEECSISFIRRIHQNTVDLALLGLWKDQKLAIPLWIMNDTLIGFEILTSAHYRVLDSFSLNFNSPFNSISHDKNNKKLIDLDNEVYYGDTLYFKIINDSLLLSDHQQINELAFFERIASTIIPEIDKDSTKDDSLDN
ncbi:MAG: hypothetical protein ACW98F_03275 [Candidatus Hodarchaeales archaeon]